MSRFHILILIVLCLPANFVGQSSFRQSFETVNPIQEAQLLEVEEKLLRHEEFYIEAKQKGDSLHEMCGLLYLVQDYLDAQDYTNASKWILASRDLAFEGNDKTWQGWVLYKEGVLNLRLREYKKSLAFYYQAAVACGAGKDSLCYAESIEQASVLNALIENYDEAENLHNQAMPLLKRFGDEEQEAKALNNLGIIFSLRGEAAKAIPYFNDAITIYRETNKKMELSKTLNNLANAYQGVGRIQESEDILLDLVKFNRQNNFTENLLSNYKNLSDVYELKNDYKTAKEYIELHYEASDSLVGIEAQNRIYQLELTHNNEKQTAAILAKENELKLAENKILIRSLAIGLLILTALAGIGFWIRNNRIKREILLKDRTALKMMTSLLKSSATQVQNLEEKLLQKIAVLKQS